MLLRHSGVPLSLLLPLLLLPFNAAAQPAPSSNQKSMSLDEIQHIGSMATSDPAVAKNPTDRISLCERGNAAMCMAVAAAFYNGNDGAAVQDLAKAAKWYEAACKASDANGCVSAAELNLRGGETARNETSARSLYSKACDLGNAVACAATAEMWGAGMGGDKNLVKARELYQKSCEGNCAAGCHNLGVAWNQGIGGSVDKARAKQAFDKACQLGRQKSCGFNPEAK
jgi:hypothetical protein